ALNLYRRIHSRAQAQACMKYNYTRTAMRRNLATRRVLAKDTLQCTSVHAQ